jgi:hypothetical protein
MKRGPQSQMERMQERKSNEQSKADGTAIAAWVVLLFLLTVLCALPIMIGGVSMPRLSPSAPLFPFSFAGILLGLCPHAHRSYSRWIVFQQRWRSPFIAPDPYLARGNHLVRASAHWTRDFIFAGRPSAARSRWRTTSALVALSFSFLFWSWRVDFFHRPVDCGIFWRRTGLARLCAASLAGSLWGTLGQHSHRNPLEYMASLASNHAAGIFPSESR